MSEWMSLMRAGRFEDAWQVCDRDLPKRRTDIESARPRHLQNIWTGSPLDGRRVLIRCYHGLGDTLQFARYLPLVRDVAQEVIVWAPARLLPLLVASFDRVRFIPLHDGAPDVGYDVDLEIMELPHVFRTTLETIPSRVPYLAAPGLARRGAPRIGLVWRGGEWDESRSIPFDLIDTLLLGSFTNAIVPLQASLSRRERTRFVNHVSCGSILALAREIHQCDLVISVDTMAAHLSGALGVPTWTLLKSSADWRWMTGRTDSPWYPSMRLFRQPRPGAWSEVLDDVVTTLRGWD